MLHELSSESVGGHGVRVLLFGMPADLMALMKAVMDKCSTTERRQRLTDYFE